MGKWNIGFKSFSIIKYALIDFYCICPYRRRPQAEMRGIEQRALIKSNKHTEPEYNNMEVRIL